MRRVPVLGLLGAGCFFLAASLASNAVAAGDGVLPLYIDGVNAPASLVSRVDDRIRALLVERGLTVVAEPAVSAGADARLAQAKKDLEKGLAAYRALQLDAAIPDLNSAATGALAAPEAAPASQVLADARIYLGIIAAATGKEADADRYFRQVAVTDPERRLDSKAFPPDTVAAYEKARKAIGAGSFAEVTLSAGADAAVFQIDGRAVPAGTVRISYGEHLFSASGEGGVAGQRFEVTEAKAAWRATLAPDVGKMLSALHVAGKRGDDSGLARAADALAATAGASRVILWDLRSSGGRVEAPIRLRDSGAHATRGPVSADLGAAVNLDPSIRATLATLFESGAVGARPVATPRTVAGGGAHRPIANWVWIAAGGAALVVAGGAAAAASSSSTTGGGDKVAVTVQH